MQLGQRELAPRRARGPTSVSAPSDRDPITQRSSSTPGSPTLNLSFGGLDAGDGIYHSIYDDYYHFTKFLDTDFAYGRALAQTVGSLVIGLADADVLPFQFTSLADTVQTYVTELQTQLKDKQTEVKELNQQIEEGVFTSIADPRRSSRAPVVESVPPSINFAPMENAASALTQAAERYRKMLDESRPRLTPDAIRTLNKSLMQSERSPDRCGGLATPVLVSAPALCAGLLYRLRRQDDARCA